MRRMRDNLKQFLWFGVPAIVAGTAILVYHSSGSKNGNAPRGISSIVAGEEDDAKDHHGKKSDSDDVSDPIPLREHAAKPGKLHPFDPQGQLDKGGLCARVELKGSAPSLSAITRDDWNKVIDVFHEAKADLGTWLSHGGGSIPASSRNEMIARMKSVKIQRPPAAEEPDLSWRGIGVLAEVGKGEPLVRVGTGLIRLVNEDRARAKFEISRLLAQSWAPCELAKSKLEAQVWNPLLKCLKVADETCGDQSYSEAGWAVSTAVASAVAPLQCVVPAFADAQVASCAKGWLTADAGGAAKGAWVDRAVANESKGDHK